MGTYSTACKAGLVVLLVALATPPVMAEETALQPLKLSARYRISWGGLTLGRIRIEAKEDATSYSMAIDTKTSGVGAIISGDRSMNTAHGNIAANFTYLPSLYESKPLDGSDRTVTKLTYDAVGKITKRERTPDDDPNWRPRVPFEEINTAHDSVSAAFVLRRKLHAAMAAGSKEISTRTYDGARLANMKITRQPDVSMEIMGKKQTLVDVTIARIPINGYTPKELKKFKKGDPEIHLYFTSDSAFLPVRASANSGFGELSMTMVENKN